MEHVYTEATEEQKSKSVLITLKPPLEFINQLPYSLKISLDVSPDIKSSCKSRHRLDVAAYPIVFVFISYITM